MVYVAIYGTNHHHFFHLVTEVDGGILWANMHLLFWLSVVPFATAWMGENEFAAVPTAIYGTALLMPAFGWSIMQAVIMRSQGPNSPLRLALGRDIKGKISPFLCLIGIRLFFVSPIASDIVYAAVALMWLGPDRRVETAAKSR